MRSIRPFVIAVVLTALVAGCDQRASSKPESSSAGSPSSNNPPAAPVKVAHAGTITGQVLFGGTPPQLPPLDTSSVPDCAKHHPHGIPDESVVVNANGTLKNVFVYVKDARASSGSAKPPAVLDQVNCQYVPHVVALQVGQPLLVKSEDSLLHNMHAARADPPLNWAFKGVAQRQTTFDKPDFFQVRCDVHQWMKAWVGVFDSPYFAVTGDDGRFTIPNLPPGRYTLAAWHERFGELTQKVDVAPDGTVKAAFTYR